MKENLERISIWLHKKKEIKYEVKATINGIPMQSHKLVKRERDPQHLETFSVMKENTNTNNMPLPLKKEEDQLSGCFTEFSQSTSQSSQSNNSWNRSQTPLAETPLPTPSATPKRDRHHSHHSHHSHHGHNRKRNRICLDPEDGIGHGMRSRSASAASSWSVNEDDKENQNPGNHNSNKHRNKDDIIQELRHRIKEMEKRHKREEKKWRDDMKQHKKDKCKWEQEKKRLMEANSKLTEQCLDRNNKFMPQIGPNGSIILSQDRYLSLSQDNDEVSDIMEPPRKKMKLEHNYTI